jgi:ubiquinone biosynthesis protein COQ9
MTDDAFDTALVSAAFALGADEGWRNVTAAAAARHAGLDLVQARNRFGGRMAILKKFGAMADGYALSSSVSDGSAKDRLFDLLLRRFDFLQLHRPGVVALLRHAPFEPGLAVWLASETSRSMGWLLEAAGISAQGGRGALRKQGLAAVWAWGIRAWLRDESEDLSGTMAAVDVALTRADQIAARFSRDGFVPETESDAGPVDLAPYPAAPEPAAPEPAASVQPASGPDLVTDDDPALPPFSPPG